MDVLDKKAAQAGKLAGAKYLLVTTLDDFEDSQQAVRSGANTSKHGASAAVASLEVEEIGEREGIPKWPVEIAADQSIKCTIPGVLQTEAVFIKVKKWN